MLIIYYRLFQESPRGIERKVVLSRFTEYVEAHREQFNAEEEAEATDDTVEGQGVSDLFSPEETLSLEPARYLAARSLRTLISAGWMSEEVLPDYTRVINMATHARPFLEALARIEEGLSVEYESHVVSIYSLLCGDAARENGHYLVLNAHAQTIALIDSLKVLSQSIREHYERLTGKAEGLDVAGILALHYDAYASDILDGAYKRLKTSDNLSRYRPRILAQVRDFLLDQAWLEESSLKYARTASLPASEARTRITTMLEEIRDTLKAVDPLLDEIDRRNMLYAKSSVERVKTLLEPASTIAGRIMRAAQALREEPSLYSRLPHHLYRVQAITPESRYRRWLKEALEPDYRETAAEDSAAFDRLETEFRLRLEQQLSPSRIVDWLDDRGGASRPLGSSELADTTEGLVKLIYAILFADSRTDSFPYHVEERKGDGMVKSGANWLVPDIALRRKL